MNATASAAPRSGPTLRGVLRWTGYVLAGLVVLVVLLVGALFVFPWNWLRGMIGGEGSAALGRELVIDGDLDVRLRWPSPVIRAERVRLTNAPWSDKPNMAELDAIEFQVHVPSLFVGRLSFPEIVLTAPRLSLERNDKGEANWNLPGFSSAKAATEAAVPSKRTTVPEIGRLAIDNGQIAYRDIPGKIDLSSTISTVTGSTGGESGINLQAEGTLQKQPVKLVASGGSLDLLRDSKEPYPLKIELNAGRSKATAEGRMGEPLQFKGVDLKVSLEGADLAELFPITLIPLPNSPPYRIAGTLRTEAEDKVLAFAPLEGKVGSSDIGGALRYDLGRDRPRVSGEVVSRRLAFEDLGGFVGAPPADKAASPEQKQEARQRAAKGKVLPDTPVDLTRLRTTDLDIRFKGERILAPGLPIQNLDAHIVLDRGRLTLQPVRFGVADGDIAGTVVLDGREDVPGFRADLNLRKISLRRFLDGTRFASLSSGLIYGRVTLAGRGHSTSEILASADGRLAARMTGGKISLLMIEAAGLDVAEAGALFLGEDKSTAIRCVVADLPVKNGVARSNALVVDTEDSQLQAQATINLKTEALDIRAEVEPKDPSPLVARSPLTVTGTMARPQIGLDVRGLAARGAAAIVLGTLLTPLAGIIAFIEPGTGEDADCGALLQRSQQGGKQ